MVLVRHVTKRGLRSPSIKPLRGGFFTSGFGIETILLQEL